MSTPTPPATLDDMCEFGSDVQAIARAVPQNKELSKLAKAFAKFVKRHLPKPPAVH